MSHIPERKEKDCLNCGALVMGRYCQVCGQENVVPKETFWHMVVHFFYDITHFDSSFFHTVHHLVLKPGFLSKEYMLGRRKKYLHPIRMYVFSSAMFFLLFFSVFSSGKEIRSNIDQPLSPAERASFIGILEDSISHGHTDSSIYRKLAMARDSTRELTQRDLLFLATHTRNVIQLTGNSYHSKKEYDSVQQSLPAGRRDGWFKRRLTRIQINLDDKFRENPDEFLSKLTESVLHRLPYLLFVSLPLFALLLKLVYIRRKQFYYADHGVFTIHLYIFTFLLLMLVFAVDKLHDATRWDFLDMVMALLFIGLFFYLFRAMKVFYGQHWFKTFLKFLFVALLSLVMMIILLVIFLVFSAVTI